MTENETGGWHHRFNGHEFEQALEDGEGQGSVVCCNPRGHKESDMTARLNNNNTASLPETEALVCQGQASECTCQATLMVHTEEHCFSGAGGYKTI